MVSEKIKPNEFANPRFEGWGDPRWPGWLEGFRAHQLGAIERCVKAFESGAKVVWLDAPTGSGKTIIGEGVRRRLDVNGLYVCSGKSLQDQFVRDFPYSRVLKGRNNYPTEKAPFPHITCADCNKDKGDDDSCTWCPSVRACAYERAKVEAYRAEVAVLNTTYLLHEANYVGGFSKQQFVVADECDMLESELMRFVEWRIGGRWLAKLKMNAPVKGARKQTILSWLEEIAGELRRHCGKLKGDEIEVQRERGTSERLATGAQQLLSALKQDPEGFVRDYDMDGGFVLKPVKVERWGQDLLWKHSEKWLCMSATIISPDELAGSLGLEDDEWELVKVPMTFPVENRPIVRYPAANLTKKTHDGEYPKLVKALEKVFEQHETDNVLVHTVSYALTKQLAKDFDGWPRPTHTYLEAKDRDRTLQNFRSKGGILFAASADRGIDLPGDLCRVVVVAKVPFPSLGDRQVSERIHSEGGQIWYQVSTVRSITQMTGRGVRSDTDTCVTYILDKQFDSQIWGKCRWLLPDWWKEGVVYGLGCDEAKNLRSR